jgi:hypothetical protein
MHIGFIIFPIQLRLRSLKLSYGASLLKRVSKTFTSKFILFDISRVMITKASRSFTTAPTSQTSSSMACSSWAPSWSSSSRCLPRKPSRSSNCTHPSWSHTEMHQRANAIMNALSCTACKDLNSQLSRTGTTSRHSMWSSMNTTREWRMEIWTG